MAEHALPLDPHYELKLNALLNWVMRAFVLGVGLDIAASVLAVVGQSIDPNWHNPNAQPSAAGGALAAAILALVLLWLVAYLFGAVSFLKWEYRVAKQTRTFASHIADKTPGWTVGWWFVPFANLVMPYRVIVRLFEANDPGAPVGERGDAPSGLLGVYWTLWLFLNVSPQMLSGLYGANPVMATWIELAIAGLQAALVVVTIRWMRLLRDWHLAKLEQPGPEDPAFGAGLHPTVDQPWADPA